MILLFQQKGSHKNTLLFALCLCGVRHTTRLVVCFVHPSLMCMLLLLLLLCRASTTQHGAPRDDMPTNRATNTQQCANKKKKNGTAARWQRSAAAQPPQKLSPAVGRVVLPPKTTHPHTCVLLCHRAAAVVAHKTLLIFSFGDGESERDLFVFATLRLWPSHQTQYMVCYVCMYMWSSAQQFIIGWYGVLWCVCGGGGGAIMGHTVIIAWVYMHYRCGVQGQKIGKDRGNTTATT